MPPLATATRLKQELDALRPLNAENEQRIMQKFRLDWNYHSNHLEGNSLTYGETKALILFNITAQGKPLQDHLEITGHNEALKWIEEVIREKRPLTENFIRQLHELILKEDYQVDAITPNGQPTKKWVRVGKYKTEPNHVKTATGEIFYFASPEETPAKMHDLLAWYRKKAAEKDVSPVLLAAEFHYRFIRIHPLDDGNGRTARILMNFILMQFGYPLAVIRTEDKQNYFAVLRQADAGVLEPFVEYITKNVIRSLELMIKGAKGEDIEEPDDLDKELALLEQYFVSTRQRIKNKKRGKETNKRESILNFYRSSVIPLFDKFFSACLKFNRFYSNSSFTLEWIVIEKGTKKHSKREGKSRENFEEFMNEIQIKIDHSFNKLVLNYYYHAMKGFTDSIHVGISVGFYSSEIVMSTSDGSMNLKKSYNIQLTDREIKEIITYEANLHKKIIEQKIVGLDEGSNPSSIES